MVTAPLPAFDDPRLKPILLAALEKALPAASCTMPPTEKQLLVLCHDDIDLLDRRILLQTKIWRARGYAVIILCATSHHRQRVERTLAHGERAIAFPMGSLLPFHDPLWLDETDEGDSAAGTTQRASSFYRVALWRIREKLFNTARHYRRFILPLMRKLNLSMHTFGSWYPAPFTATLLQYGAAYPSCVLMACDLPALPAAYHLASIWNAKLIYDAHELYPEQINYDAKQKLVLKAWEHIAIPRCNLAYTVSQPIAAFMQHTHGLATAPGVIMNAAGFQNITTGPSPLRTAIGAADTDVVFLYHGGFSRHRNLELMLQGYTQTPHRHTHLVMMGYGDIPMVQSFIANAKRNDMHLLPAVPQHVLGDWVRGATMVVIPYPAVDTNTRFCSPNKLFDCIDVGVAVLANRALENVSTILRAYGIGYGMPMDSIAQMTETFVAAANLPRIAPAQFVRAQSELGWPAQERQINRWIDAFG